MKLLQINDNEWINTDLITVISGEEDGFCWIRMVGENFGRYCDRYNAQQLMSKICEDKYYTYEDAMRRLDLYEEYFQDNMNLIHECSRKRKGVLHGNTRIRKDD